MIKTDCENIDSLEAIILDILILGQKLFQYK